tara:strand:+ start:474 stop:707 length:234 start_codon:yes stop_codon:yes gene_type:complete
MVRIYVIGISILIVAIIANFFAKIIGISTWYDFLNSFTDTTTSNFKFIDYLWLFFIYPIILGLGYFLGELISNYFKI